MPGMKHTGEARWIALEVDLWPPQAHVHAHTKEGAVEGKDWRCQGRKSTHYALEENRKMGDSLQGVSVHYREVLERKQFA